MSRVTALSLAILISLAPAVATPATPKVSVQLWSVKEAIKKDFKGTLRALADMGFQGVEFAGEFGPFATDPAGLKAFLDSLNLQVSGAHISFEQLNAKHFAQTVAFYRSLGCSLLIVPWDERAVDPQRVHIVAETLTALAPKLAPHGLQVGYHNHAQEFGAFNDSTFWDYLARSTPASVVLQLDVGWTTYAGKDPVTYVRRYPGRTLSTHFKAQLPPGTEGKLPIIGRDVIRWRDLIAASREVGGTRWFVVEQEDYPDGLTPLEAVRASKAGLDRYLSD